MSDSLFDPAWYRIEGLRPRLRAHAQVHRHKYRGQTWYVLQDHTSGRFQRFSPASWYLIGLMDGERTVQEIWDAALANFGDDAPTQSETIRLIAHLYSSDVLRTDVEPDVEEMLRRHHRIRRTRTLQSLRTPLAIRIPLLDPERLLDVLTPLFRLVLNPAGLAIWLLAVGSAIVLVALNWSALAGNISDQVFAPSNLILLGVSFPIVKALHELGHAAAVRYGGGEVHEMGIMLLVFMPIPYVDASAASAFRDKYRRALVGAAGMLVELFLAALATFVWVSVEPGLVRALAFNVMLVAGVSTLLFNGNPLLRFDAYYILADLIEIPNLYGRAQKYLQYLVQRYAFGLEHTEDPVNAPGERVWFAAYSVSAFIYRMILYAGIVVFVAGKFFFIGVLLACWAVFTMILQPLAKGIWFVAASPQLADLRGRAVLASTAAAAAIGVLLFAMPFPSRTHAEGVVWIPEDAMVRAHVDGFIEQLLVPVGRSVGRGDVLLQSSDPVLENKVLVLAAELTELRARYDAERVSDLVRSEVLREELRNAEAQLERAREKVDQLVLRSPSDGRFIVPQSDDLTGRFVRQGELLGYVIRPADVTLRCVVPQEQVDLVRRDTRAIRVRLAESVDTEVAAVIAREAPAATTDLPSPALGRAAGGDIATDPSDGGGRRSFQSLFQFELSLAEAARLGNIGGRAYVRFDHSPEPLGLQIYRGVRRLLLRQFSV